MPEPQGKNVVLPLLSVTNMRSEDSVTIEINGLFFISLLFPAPAHNRLRGLCLKAENLEASTRLVGWLFNLQLSSQLVKTCLLPRLILVGLLTDNRHFELSDLFAVGLDQLLLIFQLECCRKGSTLI